MEHMKEENFVKQTLEDFGYHVAKIEEESDL
jgi:hypothetical protein